MSEVKENVTERGRRFRQLLRIFFIDQKRQNKVTDQIKENAKSDFDFYVLTLFSGIIITLGIIIDSTPVVIGGMLIAPLVWPILALSLGVATGRSRLVQSSLIQLFKSILIILIVSSLVGLIAPELVVTNEELLSRVSPTMFELLIGLAAGFIGAFIIVYPKIGSAIAGVVVAAAIVPPIATLGLSLAKGDFNSALGSSLLFLSNLIAIAFSATILFLLANFRAHTETTQEKSKSSLVWIILMLIIIFIPLVLITKQTSSSVKRVKIVRDVVETVLGGVGVSDIKIIEKESLLSVSLTVKSAEKIDNEKIEAIQNILAQRLDNSVFMKVSIIPIVSPGEDLFTVITTENIEVKDEQPIGFLECPIIVNDQKIFRYYPDYFGCPICPKIIFCDDGSEYFAQTYNEETGTCQDIIFTDGEPCSNKFNVENNILSTSTFDN